MTPHRIRIEQHLRACDVPRYSLYILTWCRKLPKFRILVFVVFIPTAGHLERNGFCVSRRLGFLLRRRGGWALSRVCACISTAKAVAFPTAKEEGPPGRWDERPRGLGGCDRGFFGVRGGGGVGGQWVEGKSWRGVVLQWELSSALCPSPSCPSSLRL